MILLCYYLYRSELPKWRTVQTYILHTYGYQWKKRTPNSMLNPKLCRWIGFGRDRDLAIVLQQFKWKKKQTHYIWLCTLKVSNSCKWNIVKNKQNNRKKTTSALKKNEYVHVWKKTLRKFQFIRNVANVIYFSVFWCMHFFKWRFTRRFSNLFENGM